MKIRLKTFEKLMGLSENNKALTENVVFDVDTNGKENIFTQKFIIDQIINYQENHSNYNNKWIDKNELDMTKVPNELILMDTLSLQSYLRLTDIDLQSYFNNSESGKSYSCSILLTTDDEFNKYFKLYNEHFYLDNKSRNSLLILPCHTIELISAFDQYKYSDKYEYIILSAFTKYSFDRYASGEHKSIDFSYVIHKEDLDKPVLNVSVPESLMPFVIGKKGKNINLILEKLKEIPNSKIRKIKLIPTKEINERYHYILDVI